MYGCLRINVVCSFAQDSSISCIIADTEGTSRRKRQSTTAQQDITTEVTTLFANYIVDKNHTFNICLWIHSQ